MSDKNDNIFEFNFTSFWQEDPNYERENYVSAINRDTGGVVHVAAKNLTANSEQIILEQVEKFSSQYNLFKNTLNLENLHEIAQWLREESNLLRLVAVQLTFHLSKLYEHLIKIRLKTTQQILDPELPPFTPLFDREGHLEKVRLNLDKNDIKNVVNHLEKSLAPGFARSGSWEEYAKEMLTYLLISDWERIEKDLGLIAVKNMSSESRQETINRFITNETSESLAKTFSLLLPIFSQKLVPAIIEGLDLPNLTLADLDKILGFKQDNAKNSIPVTQSRLTDATLAVPTFAAFASAITVQIRKDLWGKNSSGIACFQHQAKGNTNNYIEHYITSPGDISVLPLEQAEQIIDKFGFNTVKLHLIFAAHTMNQSVPWEGKFSLKASDVVKYLGWDKRTDLPIHEKLNEIAKAAFVLDCLLVKSVWVEGRNKKGGINASTPTGRMWSVVVDPRGQLNLEGKVEKPEEVYITVQPGLIFQSFLNKAGSRLKEALYQFGYLAQDILRIDPYHDELALRLAIHLTMDSRIHATGKYRVATLLEAMLPHTVINAARSDKRKAYDLKQRWDNALKLLPQLGWQILFDESYPQWLQPGSKAPKPEDWRKIKIIDRLLQAKLTINPPEPIPELLIAKVEPKPKAQKLQPAATTKLTGDQIRKAREAKGWTQRQLAGWVGVTQTLVGYWEKGKRTPSGEMEAKLKQLLEIAD